MPDPYDHSSISEYISRNPARVEQASRTGPEVDRRKALKAMRMAEAKPKPDLIVDLLLERSAKMRSAAYPFLVGKTAVELSPAQLRRLALGGDFMTTRIALEYTRTHSRSD